MKNVLGILGGGQLALFMCDAARKLGIETIVLSPDEDAPARKACSEFLKADYGDTLALQKLADQCDVVTLDNEHIPEQTLLALATNVAVFPQPRVMSRLQDRLSQRGLLTQLNIPQVRFWSLDKSPALRAATFPAVLKRRHGGYDGYGQVRVASAQELEPAWQQLDQTPCILEAWVDDVVEFSIVGVRSHDGQMKLYPPIANWHRQGRLFRSDLPAEIAPEKTNIAEKIWRRIAGSLNIRGVLTVEFFITKTQDVLVNEIAPRVHNSGHVTQLVSPHCQFMAHVSAVMRLPLPDIEPLMGGSMWNLYPSHDLHDPARAAQQERDTGGRIILYGKAPRPNRKMGHWLAAAEQRANVARVMESGRQE